MEGKLYDVLIIGAGPAGSTAAILLARQNLRVLVLDRDAFPRTSVRAGWLNARALPVLQQIGVPTTALEGRAFRQITFHSADFSKTATPNLKDAPGYLVDRTQLANELVEAARRAGVTVQAGVQVVDLRQHENHVTAKVPGGSEFSGRELLLASGLGSPLVQRAGFPGRVERVLLTAQVDSPKGSGAEHRVAVVLGLDRGGSFAVCCVANDHTSVTLNWAGPAQQTKPVLAQLCRALHDHQVAPVDLSEDATRASVAPSPAAAALDMDTHVGKHTLLIGDAGGFVSAASNEGLYPAMWSAQIAAEVVATALKARRPQDELLAFEQKWRMTMADYLRAPNTDIQFLLPLIFTNQPMADRMAAAFFSGENI